MRDFAVIAILLSGGPAALGAQQPPPTPLLATLGPRNLGHRPLLDNPAPSRFPVDSSLANRLRIARSIEDRDRRVPHAVVGGLIGAAAGIVVCTAISNLVREPGTGFSTCTTSGYLGLGLGGLAVGATIGALIR